MTTTTTSTRRALVRGVLVSGAMGSASTRATSGQETATPERVEPVSVDEIVRRLQTQPIASTLFPGDTGTLAITGWADDRDEDLAGTVGAFVVRDTAIDDADTALIGAYIVHPTVRSAEERLMRQIADGPDEQPLALFGRPGASARYEDGSSLVVVVDGVVIVSAIGKSQAPIPLVTEGSSFQEPDLRALANLAGLLDHLRQTLMVPT